jgi:hypothetical protein
MRRVRRNKVALQRRERRLRLALFFCPMNPHRLFSAVVLLTMSLAAQTPAPPPPPPPEAHQFDFWIGEWEVTGPKGRIAGTNRIEAIAKGRGLLENWTSAGGGDGKSLNTYNPTKKQWQQFWVGADGSVLELSGGLDAKGNMVLADATNRITWTPNADGSVRQLWESTKDGGKTWTIAFDGTYRKKK